MLIVNLSRAAAVAALALTFVALGAALPSPAVAAANKLAWIKHRDVNLIALPPAGGVAYDVDLYGASKALGKLRAALDALIEASPFNAKALAALRRDGGVFIVYDPRYPETLTPDFIHARLAAFRPGLFDNAGQLTDGTAFAVVVGRYLVKWPSREIAAVLAQEIVGHGMQQLEGRFETMRERDAQCEAGLYREKAHQDFGFNKRSALRVKFRQTLEWHWCTDFKRYMKARAPARMALWKELNPDVPQLLAVFADYMAGPVTAVAAAPAAEPTLQTAPVAALEPVAPPIAAWEKALGPEHPDVATSLNNLAGLYHKQGKYPEAEPLYQRALAIYEKALGPEHPYVAMSLENYASLLRQTGRDTEAEEMEAHAQVIRAKQAGE